MNDLLSVLMSQMGGDTIGRMSNMIGENPKNTRSTINNSWPVLINAQAKNSSNNSGTCALQNAPDRDHDGSILGDLLDQFKGNVSRTKGPKQQSLIENLLDAGNDGSIVDNLTKIGGSLLGKFLRR